MNCLDIERLILAERDGLLTTHQQASLDRHVAACPSCQQFRVRFSEAMAFFRTETVNIVVPDIEQEWQKVRAHLHDQSGTAAKKSPLTPVIWFGASLAAAAALAFAYVGSQPQSIQQALPAAGVEIARADYVEAGDTNASTMVYVDKDSGWLVVWAADTDAASRG